MYELTILCEFEAAHFIPDYPGKCSRLHGHNWKVEVAVSANKLNNLGMVIDFRDFKFEANKVIDSLDHSYLNESEPFKNTPPTAENIAKYIFDQLAANSNLSDVIHIEYVKVWESPRAAVKYSPQLS